MEDSREADAPRRRVLIIAYYWPPAGGPGVQRWLKFTKYLPDCGWQPTMVVPLGAAYPVEDASLGADVSEDMEVHHIPIFEPYEWVLRLFRKKGKTERLGSISTGKQRESPAQKLMLWARGNLLLPDPRVLWRKPCRRSVLALLKKAAASGNPYEAVITTGPPHSVHLIGLDVKRKTGLPWIADFRDPWREMDYLADFHPTARTRRRHLQMEGAVVAHCNAVLSTSKGIQTSFSVHPDADRKINLIPNGWDEADYETETAGKPLFTAQPSSCWHLGHFGSAFPIRNAPGLWEAIARHNASDGKTIHLHFFGVVNGEVAADLNHHLKGHWTDHGYINHREAVGAMRAMDALLILQNRSESGRHAIPGKTFEYLAHDKPLAVVTPSPSDLDDLIREWGFTTIGYEDPHAAGALLQELMTNPRPKAQVRIAYTRRQLTAELGNLLDKLTTPN